MPRGPPRTAPRRVGRGTAATATAAVARAAALAAAGAPAGNGAGGALVKAPGKGASAEDVPDHGRSAADLERSAAEPGQRRASGTVRWTSSCTRSSPRSPFRSATSWTWTSRRRGGDVAFPLLDALFYGARVRCPPRTGGVYQRAATVDVAAEAEAAPAYEKEGEGVPRRLLKRSRRAHGPKPWRSLYGGASAPPDRRAIAQRGPDPGADRHRERAR